MSLLAAAVAAGLWVGVGLIGYVVLAYVALFYLPPADRLPNGAVADAAFVATAPFVLAVTWLATLRH